MISGSGALQSVGHHIMEPLVSENHLEKPSLINKPKVKSWSRQRITLLRCNDAFNCSFRAWLLLPGALRAVPACTRY
jgi:hypothetical protein